MRTSAPREVTGEMRRTHRTDDTQRDIVAALRRCGVKVWPIGQPCDLLCFVAGSYSLLDCDGITEYRKRDAKQLEKFAEWGVKIVGTPEAALKAVGL